MAPEPEYIPLHGEADGEGDTRSIRSTTSTLVRPHIYYDDGPFEASSSDSSEEDLLLTAKQDVEVQPEPNPSPGAAERGAVFELPVKEKRASSLRVLVIILASLVGAAALIGIVASLTYTGGSGLYHAPGTRKITMEHIFNGTFSPEHVSLHWVKEAGDGVFSVEEGEFIRLVDFKSNKTTDLVNRQDVTDENGEPITKWAEWRLSPDMKHIIVKTDQVKLWRHSSFGNFYVHTIASKETRSLSTPRHPPTATYATWSPKGDVAYVDNGDLYVLPLASGNFDGPIRITTTGSTLQTNAIPDWVYEEEVLGGPFALWFSPDGGKIAFMSFDDTNVDVFQFEVFNPTEDNDAIIPYTTPTKVRYPKPGYTNPTVDAYMFDLEAYVKARPTVSAPHVVALAKSLHRLSWTPRAPSDDRVLMEVAWVSDMRVIVKEVNRNADIGRVVLFDFANDRLRPGVLQGTIARKLGREGEQGDNGWIDATQTIHSLPAALRDKMDGYLDVVPSKDGYNHVALFSPASSSKPIWLTSGSWEVTGKIQGVRVDEKGDGVVYFTAANPLSTSRHLYSVTFTPGAEVKVGKVTALTYDQDATDNVKDRETLYRSSFSPNAGFYLLNYEGPGVPWQKVKASADKGFNLDVGMNEVLVNRTAEYEAPTIVYGTIEIDGIEFNYRETRPPRMDDSGRTKYAVLFQVYGGPASQMVDLTFSPDWHWYLSCRLQYIIVSVDGRGTGYKGRKIRNFVKSNLGFWETHDQIEAGRMWAAKDYVDPKRIGIWGWSYGGFMSSKVAEANAGVHSLAMAVAPVTSWRLYDSIYTERYMNLPDVNPGGYINASITDVEGFKHINYLLAHGTADDNVHFANTAHLLDMFVKAQVRGYRFRIFVDSDHSIRKRGANREVYEFMTDFLIEKWGKGGKRRGW
ncbi:hypothetical protein FISHEDRAFT_70393 [Fistulina hepatica ATCC 64428]|uniref:Dipeptidyl aminopeptidase n=1 Tax=Fistulina hepatica ATCC 64428 TaxID=1128425 RepID=A0A0D7AM90_9AGAR|nr:hypothetical protein FISHEDRAFT_70393 [Fistulina hepatica ATCC 64428]